MVDYSYPSLREQRDMGWDKDSDGVYFRNVWNLVLKARAAVNELEALGIDWRTWSPSDPR